jgi:hypothetical protein
MLFLIMMTVHPCAVPSGCCFIGNVGSTFRSEVSFRDQHYAYVLEALVGFDFVIMSGEPINVPQHCV